MNDENINNKIFNLIGEKPDKLAIIDQNIPIKIQIEYFDFAGTIRKEKISINVKEGNEILQNKKSSLKLKKEILSKLATIEEPEAYRAIEKYVNNPDKKIINWAKLALFESKMLLESSILNQNHVLISSGLGGKNDMLRYYIVIFTKKDKEFNKLYKKIVRNEFDDFIIKQNCEIEKIKFEKTYVSFFCLIPLNINIKEIFAKAIFECNQYGNFLIEHFVVTNVKKLTIKEINDFINKYNLYSDDENN